MHQCSNITGKKREKNRLEIGKMHKMSSKQVREKRESLLLFKDALFTNNKKKTAHDAEIKSLKFNNNRQSDMSILL